MRLIINRADRRGAAFAPDRPQGGPERPHGMEERPAQRVVRPQPLQADAPSASRLELRLAGQVLAIVAVLTVSFLLELTVLGNLRYDRDQAQLAAEFRSELANAVAPVGPLDAENKPLAAGAPVALLEIPWLGVREIVVQGTSSGTLMSGPGHRRDTPLPGQAGTSVIAGRRATYGGPFGSIDQLHAGDEITVTTGQGKSSFVVLEVRHAGDPLPLALPPGQGRLTLVTTDVPARRGIPFLPAALQPSDVLRVDAKLISAAQPFGGQLPSRVLPPAEAVLAGDSSALLGVVGWAVLLVAAAVATVWVRFRTGWWQAWVIGVPVLVALALTAFDEIAAMLPNVL
ncbi:MAG TPA: class E sortase [Mycobacterium sp.]|nr:class E sortase [Mycobacterium sp.]